MEVDENAVAIRAAQVRQNVTDRVGMPSPASFGLMVRKAWPQEMPVRELLAMVGAWCDLTRATLYRLGAEDWAHDPIDPIAVRAVAAVFHDKPNLLELAYRAANDASLARHWERHRIVYAVHPGLADALADTAGTGEIPASVLRRLPHPDPLFLFPTGVRVALSTGEPGVMRGFFVTGLLPSAPGPVRTSSADPDADRLQVATLCQVGEPDTIQSDWDLSAVSIPMTGRFTAESLVRSSAARWSASPDCADLSTPETISNWVAEMMRVCLPVLLYACSAEPDSVRLARPPARKAGKGRTRSTPRPEVHQLGYRVGPELLAARARYERQPGGQRAGRTVRAHVRRAHWHTYRTGPGRTETAIRWLSPVLVHGGGSEVPTVIGVRPH